jgi:hypothetical protein
MREYALAHSFYFEIKVVKNVHTSLRFHRNKRREIKRKLISFLAAAVKMMVLSSTAAAVGENCASVDFLVTALRLVETYACSAYLLQLSTYAVRVPIIKPGTAVALRNVSVAWLSSTAATSAAVCFGAVMLSAVSCRCVAVGPSLQVEIACYGCF